jgi:hypothetical protein
MLLHMASFIYGSRVEAARGNGIVYGGEATQQVAGIDEVLFLASACSSVVKTDIMTADKSTQLGRGVSLYEL